MVRATALAHLADIVRPALESTEEAVVGVLELALVQLDMDAAVVSLFLGGEELYRALAGDEESFCLGPGSVLVVDTYCRGAGDELLPNLVRDVRDDSRVACLPATRAANIGAYLRVPVRVRGAGLAGALVCFSHLAAPTLNERDLRLLHRLADLAAEQIEGRVPTRRAECAARQKSARGLWKTGGIGRRVRAAYP